MPTKTSPTCPFCSIATAHPPLPPSSALQTIPQQLQQYDSSFPGSSQRSHAFLVLSTKYVLAFLDIMPLSKGHILVVTREHYEKVGELGVRIGEEVCLPSFLFLGSCYVRLIGRFV
jgi:diadenosine tetraphosphate (Ap4A) HIT family hydrolase